VKRSGRILGLRGRVGVAVVATALVGTLGLAQARAATVGPTIVGMPKVYGPLVTTRAMCPGDVGSDYNALNDPYSLYEQARDMGVGSYYWGGYFGYDRVNNRPIDVAMIDSGVADVPGFDSGNVVDGPDLSFESQAQYAVGPDATANPDLAHNDTFGHGTHMGSIIVGRDDPNGSNANGHVPYSWTDPTKFTGVAPGARLISLKVADATGAVDVTQMIAAVDWVVQHRDDNGLHIRVLNLSYGVITKADVSRDALTYALQQAWNAGIVVVVAAGNAGDTAATQTILAPA